MTTFYFNTGVRRSINSYAEPRDVWQPCGMDSVRLIPFDCEDVPEGSQLMFLCPYPTLAESKLPFVIVRRVSNTTMCSEYAYFRLPLSKEEGKTEGWNQLVELDPEARELLAKISAGK
jgi:hypothetical protein